MAVYLRADSKTWWMCVSVAGGRPLRKSTGIPRDAPTSKERAELRRAAESVYVREQAEVVLRGRGLAPKLRRTLSDHLDWYETHVTVHKKSAAREREILKSLRAALGAITLKDLTRERILEWRTARLQDKLPRRPAKRVSPSTINREFDVLRHALGQAVPTYLDASPAEGVKRLFAPTLAETHVLTRDDEAAILEVLVPADRVIVIAALDTLMRAGDLLRLEWAQDHGKYLTVLNPKTGSPYKVPVSTRLRAALDTLPRSKDASYVFYHRRHATTARLQTNSLKSMLEDACARARVSYGRGQGITFHALRHTGASRMVESGVDLRTVMEIGGWRSLRMLDRYVHATDARKTEAVELIGKGVPFGCLARPGADSTARRAGTETDAVPDLRETRVVLSFAISR